MIAKKKKLPIAKIGRSVFEYLTKEAEAHAGVEAYLLGADENDIVMRAIPLIRTGGCGQMPTISMEDVAAKSAALWGSGFRVCGIGRAGSGICTSYYGLTFSTRNGRSFVLCVKGGDKPYRVECLPYNRPKGRLKELRYKIISEGKEVKKNGKKSSKQREKHQR